MQLNSELSQARAEKYQPNLNSRIIQFQLTVSFIRVALVSKIALAADAATAQTDASNHESCSVQGASHKELVMDLQYRGAKYPAHFQNPDVHSEKAQLRLQQPQTDAINQTYAILRYRGVLYIRSNPRFKQSNRIRLIYFPISFS